RYALGVLNNSLGGGMSSRLFQEVREKRGLVYSVYSYASHHAETGSFGVYAGCQPGHVRDVLGVVTDVLAEVARDGLTIEEVERGKGQFRGGVVLGLEDTGSRMTRIGKSELSYGEQVDLAELLGRIDAVTVADVRDLATELLSRPMCLAVVGPFPDGEFDGDL
nr:insulinase family protein [Geodermatophilaceae bacterium]